jgi:hypothetical protein
VLVAGIGSVLVAGIGSALVLVAVRGATALCSTASGLAGLRRFHATKIAAAKQQNMRMTFNGTKI